MMANPQAHASSSTHLAINPHYSPHPHHLPRTHSSPAPHQNQIQDPYSPNIQHQMYGQSHSPPYYTYTYNTSNPGTPTRVHQHANNNPPPISLPAAILRRSGTTSSKAGRGAPSGSSSVDVTTRGRQKKSDHPGTNVFYDFTSTNSIRAARDSNNKYIINQYTIIRRVGNGQHGYVFEAWDQNNQRRVAIKSCKRKTTESKLERLRRNNNYGAYSANGGNGLPRQVAPGKVQLYNEIQEAERKILYEIAIMKKLRHGQIVQLYEVINDPLSTKIFMVMEFMAGGEVCWRDKNEKPVLTVDQARRICRDVALGLEFLHHQGIIHRDIKPANLLWTDDRKNVKISDFGVSHHSAALRLRNLRDSMRTQVQWKQQESSKTADKMRVEVRGRVYKGKILEDPDERVGRERERTRESGRWRGVGKGKGRVTTDASWKTTDPEKALTKHDTESIDQDDPYKNVSFNSIIEETTDPILLTNDEGLSRQAGSPSFIAPEVVWEFRRDWVENVGGWRGKTKKSKERKVKARVEVKPVEEKTAGTGNGVCSCAPGKACASAASASTSASTSAAVSTSPSSAGLDSPTSPTSGPPPSPPSILSPTASVSSKRLSISSRNSIRRRLSQVEQVGDMNAMVGGYVYHGDSDTEKGKEKEEKGIRVWLGKKVGKVDEEDEKETIGGQDKDEGTPVPKCREGRMPDVPQDDDHTVEIPPNSDTDEDDEDDEGVEDMGPRPEITKAIDVWALGVTLYCLLMGRCPWTGSSEYALYVNLRTDDFDVEETMGHDAVPTGGRHHDEQDKSEGAVVVRLLERLLEKDYRRRITLEEVKCLPWITRDIPNPEAWIHETSPYHHDAINVTAEEESSVFTNILFKWKPKILNKVVNTLTGRSAKNSQDSLSRVVTRTDENSLQRVSSRRKRVTYVPRDVVGPVDKRAMKKLARHSTTGTGTSLSVRSGSSRHGFVPELFVSTDRTKSRSRPSSRGGSRIGRERSGSDFARTPSGSNVTSPSTAGYTSDEILSTEDERNLTQSPRRPFHSPTQQLTAGYGQSRHQPSRSQEQGRRKKSKDGLAQKSRLSLSSFLHFSSKGDGHKKDKEALSQRRSADEFTALSFAEAGSSRTGGTGGPPGGNSIAAGARTGSDPSAGGLMNLAGDGAGALTTEMRASSWGEVQHRQMAGMYRPDYGDGSDDDESFDFGLEEYKLDEHTMMVGAGGIQASPMHSRTGSVVASREGSRAPSPMYGYGGETGSLYAAENLQLHRHRSIGRDYGSRSPPADGRVPLPNIPPQQQEWLYEPHDVAHIPNPAAKEQVRQSRSQHQMSSPLARAPYSVDSDMDHVGAYVQGGQGENDTREQQHRVRQQLEHQHDYRRRSGVSDEYLEAEDSDLGERVFGNGSTVLDGGDEFDDESSSEEQLEVRRRRPSEVLSRSRSRPRVVED